MMDPTPTSFWLAAQAVRYWHARGAIEYDSMIQLINIATYASPALRGAARRVVGEVGCAHMIEAGERRGRG